MDNPSSNDIGKFVTEENRHKNLEIPIFELEQRVERIEQGYTSMQAELIKNLADSVSQRFNLSLGTYFPKFNKTLENLEKWQNAVKGKLGDLIRNDRNGGKESELFQKLEMSVNNNNTEMMLMKKMFTFDKLKAMDKLGNEVKNLSYKIEIMKLHNE